MPLGSHPRSSAPGEAQLQKVVLGREEPSTPDANAECCPEGKNVDSSQRSENNSYLSMQKLLSVSAVKYGENSLRGPLPGHFPPLQNRHLFTLHLNTLWVQNLEQLIGEATIKMSENAPDLKLSQSV